MDVKITYAQSAPQQPQAPSPTYPSYNYPAPNLNPAYPQPVQVVQPQGCFARNKRNKPQSNSAGAAALVFISGGMNIALGVGPIPFAYIMLIHMRISWFIGAIIGAIFGAVLCNRLSKKLFYLISSLLITSGGILFVSLKNDVGGLIAARYLDGIANGFVLVPTLVMAGEEAVKSVRGMIASSIETMCFGLGIFLQLIISSSWLSSPTLSLGPIQIQGLLSIIYGVISMIFAFFLVIESPVFFLLRGEEQNAIDSLRRLQRPFVVTTETYEQFEEHKRYIAINRELSFDQSAIAGLPALFKLCIYRGLLALSYSSLLNLVFLVAAVKVNAGYDFTSLYIYGTLRFLGLIISVFMMDSVGRKKPMLVGMIICAGMAIGIGGSIINAPLDLSAVPALMFVFQFFAGIASASSSVYLSEAFPLAIKPYYIASAFIVEMIVHIILCSVSQADAGAFFCTVGSFMAAFFVFALLFMPETKQTTLREAQEKFRKFK